MTPEQFGLWIERCSSAYAADLVTLGSSDDEARIQARATIAGAFPEARAAADNAVFDLVDGEGVTVGYVWVGTDHSDDPRAWWIWDIAVEPEHRGRGYGKAGMRLAEEYASSLGASTLGLSVFGFNSSARGLYESLGYETTSVKMRKTLVHD